MRILMVAPFWSPVRGGGERVLQESSLALHARGHDVDILTLNTDADRRAVWSRQELRWNGLRVLRWPAINLVPRKQGALNHLARRVQGRVFPHNYVLKYLYRPGFARQAVGYDLIQMHNDIEAGFMWLLRNSTAPRVLWCHTLDVTYPSHYEHHRLTREILRNAADFFLTGCRATVASLRHMDIPPERIGTVHYAVDEAVFQPRPELKTRKTVLFVGGLQHHKGVLVLMQALRCMRQPAHVVLLTISRNQAYGERFLQELAAEEARGFHTFEHVPDLRDRDRLIRFYQEASVLATPSFKAVFELVNLEAMACATPVVATRVGGFPEMIEDGVNGYLVAPGDPEALANKLDEVLMHSELARRLGEAGRRVVVREFTWTRAAEKLERCYEMLIRERVGRSALPQPPRARS